MPDGWDGQDDFDSTFAQANNASSADASGTVKSQQANAAGYAKDGIEHDPDFNTELSNLQLSSIMFAPLKASIQGMAQASRNAIYFIKTVCFSRGSGNTMGDPRMVKFKIQKPGGTLGMVNNYATVTIPFMTMVHIPYLRLEKVVVDFTVKLTSSRTQNLSASQGRTNITSKTAEKSGSSFKGEFQGNEQETIGEDGETSTETVFDPLQGEKEEWSNTASFTGLTSTREETKSGNEIKKEYSLNVVITATQDALPVGIEKMMDILEAEIKDSSGDAAASQLTGKLLSSIQAPLGGGGAAPAAAAAAGGV